MLTEVGANKYQFIGKAVILIILLGCVGLFVYVTIYPRGEQLTSSLVTPTIFIFLFSILSLVMFIQLIFLPAGVSFETTSNQMTIRFLLLTSKTLSLDEIETYATTSIYTKSSQYEGLLLHLKNGKKLLLSDFNLKD